MTNSDWATDVATRKSRSAIHIYVGDNLLYSFTRRQSVIAQSSGEAELYATAAGVSEGILLRKVLGFCVIILGLRTISDSAANNAMTHRLGVGRVRNLDVKVLWLQQMVYQGLLTMTWQSGKYNNTDLGTRVLGKARFQELVEMCRLKPLNGGPGKVHQVRTTPAEGSVLTPTQAGQILTMVTWLSQVGKSDPDLDRSNDADYMLLVMLLIAFGAGWTLAWIWSWYRSTRCYQNDEPEDLVFYKTGSDTVLHSERDCDHLKAGKRIDAWTVCKDCNRKKTR